MNGKFKLFRQIPPLRIYTLVRKLSFFVILAAIAATSALSTPVNRIARYRLEFNINGHLMRIPVARNKALDDTTRDFTRAVVVIHGTSRNADDYYLHILGPAKWSGHADLFTLIISPQFLTEEDVNKFKPGNAILYWSNSGWKKGDLSRTSSKNPRPVKISSFAIMDSILLQIVKNQPGIKNITLVGHSAGAQFVNRYAAGNRSEQVLKTQYGAKIRYIVANPSSYLYFNKERRIGDSTTEFAVPSHPPCYDYNDYKYGLNHLNDYMKHVGADSIRAQYHRREIVYLLGSEDTDPNSSSLDKSCPAKLQGRFRLERGIIYYNYLLYLFGAQIAQNQFKAIVEGVGHSSTDMFASACGKYYIFDYGECGSTLIAASKPRPSKYILLYNYPNPFNPMTTLLFELADPQQVWLTVFNLLGEPVSTLIAGELLMRGEHKCQWNARAFPTGLYFARLVTSSGATSIKRLVLLK